MKKIEDILKGFGVSEMLGQRYKLAKALHEWIKSELEVVFGRDYVGREQLEEDIKSRFGINGERYENRD